MRENKCDKTSSNCEKVHKTTGAGRRRNSIKHAKNETTRRSIATGLFILGLVIIIYPHAAQYLNNLYATRLVENYFAQDIDEANGIGEIGEPGPGNQTATDNSTAKDSDAIDVNSNGNDSFNEYGQDIFGSIRIPKLGLELPIFTGSTSENLNRGVAHLEGTSLPVGGKSTHSVLCGHNGSITNEWFTHIDMLAEGDLFYVRTREQTLTYQVISIKIISPDDMSELFIRPEEDLVTLLTCTRGGKMRLIVTGKRVMDGTVF